VDRLIKVSHKTCGALLGTSSQDKDEKIDVSKFIFVDGKRPKGTSKAFGVCRKCGELVTPQEAKIDL
jgi:hypothetical protein